MRLHRFYLVPDVELKHDFWLHDERLINQWRKVLRFQPGQEVVLFDGVEHERLYKLTEISDREAHLELITEYRRKLPSKEIYLLWSLLKKDKNDWVLQKATELGVSHFIPLLADRSEKTGFNLERARKIVIEASEQCGRGDIPAIREPMTTETAINDYKEKIQLLICEQDPDLRSTDYGLHNAMGVLIGPEGGWSEKENELFNQNKLQHLNLHDFTLRAETAAIAAINTILAPRITV